MIVSRQSVLFLLCLVAGLALVSCQAQESDDASPAFDRDVLFGDGVPDKSEVICRVGDFAITERQLDLRLAEVPESQRGRYEGPYGRRLLLNRMIEEVFLVQAGYAGELYNDADVAHTLIANRRLTMANAMLHTGLLKDREPTIDEIREYYLAHRDRYINQGIMQARHIECATKADADRAYDRLRNGEGRQALFPYVAGDFSINEKTRVSGGDLGWFNKGGYIAMIPDSKDFIDAVWDLEIGLHPPLEVNGRWHIVEVVRREYARPMTLEEAEFKVKQEMMPSFQQEIVAAFYADRLAETPVTYYGAYRPGEGKTDRQLFERAFHTQDPERKQDLYELLLQDYPTSDLIDDALFMLGDVAMDELYDPRQAENYLRRLLVEYPESEYADDARYILENLDNPAARRPIGNEVTPR